MKKITTLAFIIISSDFALSGEIRQDAGFYAARGFSRASDSIVATREACIDARKALVGSVFGEVVQINQNAVRSFGVIDYAEDSHVSSERVQLVGWTQELSKQSDLTICTIQYPSSEAEVEKQRLKGSQGVSGIQYTEIGDAADDLSGSINVITYPSNANIFVDHERWGTSPLSLRNKLTVGEHLLKIELNNFDPIEEFIQIRAGVHTQVIRNLKRATSTLSIVTIPADAQIMVNDQSWGNSPTAPRQILSGQTVRIQIQHPQAETYSQTLQLSRNEIKQLEIKLPMKPAFLSFQVTPDDGVTAELDGIELKNWTKAKIEAGSHNLKIKKHGFREENISFKAEGNKTTVLKTIELKQQTESEKKLEVQVERSKNPPIVLSYGAYVFGSTFKNYNFSTQGTKFTAEYCFSEIVGRISLGYSHGTGTLQYSNGTLNLSQDRTTIGIPITLSSENSSQFVVDAGFSQINTTLTMPGSSNSVLVNQKATELWVRWHKWSTVGLIPVGLTLSVGGTSAEDANNNFNGTVSPQVGLDLSLGF